MHFLWGFISIVDEQTRSRDFYATKEKSQQRPLSPESSEVCNTHMHSPYTATFDVLADAYARPHVEGIEGAVAAYRQGRAPGCRKRGSAWKLKLWHELVAAQQPPRGDMSGRNSSSGARGATQHPTNPS